MTSTTNRYLVTIRTCQAPSTNGGKYRRPVVVRVVDTTSGPSDWYWHRTGIVSQWHNVDSRYSGPRSAYGQARREAEQLASELNRSILPMPERVERQPIAA